MVSGRFAAVLDVVGSSIARGAPGKTSSPGSLPAQFLEALPSVTPQARIVYGSDSRTRHIRVHGWSCT